MNRLAIVLLTLMAVPAIADPDPDPDETSEPTQKPKKSAKAAKKTKKKGTKKKHKKDADTVDSKKKPDEIEMADDPTAAHRRRIPSRPPTRP